MLGPRLAKARPKRGCCAHTCRLEDLQALLRLAAFPVSPLPPCEEYHDARRRAPRSQHLFGRIAGINLLATAPALDSFLARGLARN
jgi:hypothetical protein